MTRIPLISLHTGVVAPLGRKHVPSGIVKSAVSGPIFLSETGFSGDQQGDTVRHGGSEKAVHHYPFDHYAEWRRDFGALPQFTYPGVFGENISALGLTEETVAIGDVFALGTAVVEISQGRQPCWKLNARFDRPDMARQVQATGRTGWYYRVLTPGLGAPEDGLMLLERHSPDWTLKRIWRAFYVDTLNRTELAGIAALDRLAEGWRTHATRRLESNRVEDWSKRLDGAQ